MMATADTQQRVFRIACSVALLMFAAGMAIAEAPIVQPGAPGQPARELSAEEAMEIADTS